jgi:hypothetical protein
MQNLFKFDQFKNRQLYDTFGRGNKIIKDSQRIEEEKTLRTCLVTMTFDLCEESEIGHSMTSQSPIPEERRIGLGLSKMG